MRMLAFPARHKKLHKKDQFLMLHNLQVNLILQAVWCFLFQVGFISFIHKLVCSFVCLSRFGFLFFFFFFLFKATGNFVSRCRFDFHCCDNAVSCLGLFFFVWPFSFMSNWFSADQFVVALSVQAWSVWCLASEKLVLQLESWNFCKK